MSETSPVNQSGLKSFGAEFFLKLKEWIKDNYTAVDSYTKAEADKTFLKRSDALQIGETETTAYKGSSGKANADAIAKLSTRVDTLEKGTDVTILQDKVTSLESTVNTQDKKITALESTVTTQSEKITALESRVKALEDSTEKATFATDADVSDLGITITQ